MSVLMWDRSRETDILLLLLSWISLAMQGSGYCTETLASLFLSFPSSALSFLVTCLQSIFLSHFLFSSLLLFICSPLFIHFYLESEKRFLCRPSILHCPPRNLGKEARAVLSLYSAQGSCGSLGPRPLRGSIQHEGYSVGCRN